ncbi:MAG: DinB family protein [Planctomycetota bacterium]|nr:DinB family protein [Planctomycetota bacterium]
MRAVDVFLRQFDEAWEHDWESLQPQLAGLTEEEASWQAPCYADAAREPGWPLPGSIHWHVAHLVHYRREYTARIRGQEEPSDSASPAATFEESMRQLVAIHRAQRAAIAALSDDDLTRDAGNGIPLDEYLTSTIRHDIWHAGQIAVARRLARNRSDSR